MDMEEGECTTDSRGKGKGKREKQSKFPVTIFFNMWKLK